MPRGVYTRKFQGILGHNTLGGRLKSGLRKPLDTVSIGVNLPFETFKYLKKAARRDKTSFSEQVRTFIEWGINSIDKQF